MNEKRRMYICCKLDDTLFFSADVNLSICVTCLPCVSLLIIDLLYVQHLSISSNVFIKVRNKLPLVFFFFFNFLICLEFTLYARFSHTTLLVSRVIFFFF